MSWSTSVSRVTLAAIVAASAIPAAPAAAQTTAASIVGIVTDASGAPLPGVTIEAGSPALIERSKIAVSAADGRYQIVDLRPGEYVLSFSLPGFQTVRREGLSLSAAFTATVHAALPVGRIEEQVIVRGGDRVIDLRSGTSERALHQELLEGIPVGRIPNTAVMVVPGAVTSRPDVGGSETGQTVGVSIHGSQTRDLVWNTDGLDMTSNTGSGGLSGQYPNQGAYQEIVVRTRALPAEVGAGGVSVNLITRDGGSRFRADAFGTFANGALQSRNASEEQRRRGLTAPSATDVFYDVNAGAGGPLAQDRAWYFASARRFRIDRFEANTFNPDGTQALDENLIYNLTGKVTWQVTPANRLSSFVDYNYKLREHRRQTTPAYQFVSPEASYYSPLWGPVANVKLTSAIRPTLLLESGLSWYYVPWSLEYQPDLPAGALPRIDIARSTLTGAPPPAMLRASQERRTASGVLSWLGRWRGEHQVRAGVQFQLAPYGQTFDSLGRGDLVARYRDGVPDSVVVYNTPVATSLTQTELGVFLQDAWTMGRLTINAGIRFERLGGSLNDQSARAGAFVPARTFAAQRGLVRWNTVVPRLAATVDLGGDGRTVLKATLSQYTQRQGAQLVDQFNPLRQNTEVRTWIDANGDGIPQRGEIGPGQGGLDRGATVRIDPGLRRPRQWEATASLERQLAEDLALTVAYYHRRHVDLTAVVNRAIGPEDFTPVAILNPLTGQPFTIYNQSAASLGRVDNWLVNSDALQHWYHGAQVTLNRRYRNGLMLFGGVTFGWNRVAGSASTNPNDHLNAGGYDLLDTPIAATVSAAYRLPWSVHVSGRLAHYAGQPLRRIYTVTRTVLPELRQASQDVRLLPAGAVRKPNQTLLDVRLGRRFGVAPGLSVEPLFEIYNLLNENAALTEVEQVGAALGRISRNLDGRLIRFGIKASF